MHTHCKFVTVYVYKYTGKGESAEPAEGFGTERESKKAQRVEKVWQKGNVITHVTLGIIMLL